MSWSTITAAEVLQEFTPQEQAAINAIQGATTQLGSMLARIVNVWRGAISRNQELDAANTIPGEVREDVIAEARWRWLVSLPKLQSLQTKERNDLYKDALAHLEKIREGQRVETSSTEVGANPITGTWNSENRFNMRTHPVPRPPDAVSTDNANPANDE